MKLTALLPAMRMRPWTRAQQTTLPLLGAVALSLLPHLGTVFIGWGLLALCLCAWRLSITLRTTQGEPTLPPKWLLSLLLIGLVAALALYYRTLLGRDAGVSFLICLQALKTLEAKERRDWLVVIFLSFFVMLTVFMFRQGLLETVWMSATATLLMFAWLTQNHLALLPPWRKRLTTTLRMMMLGAPLMVLLFVFFPRIATPLWSIPQDAHTGRSGFSESMQPGGIAALSLSDEIAFRVQFTEAIPASAQLYWRGLTLDSYDGQSWRSSQVPILQSLPNDLAAFTPPAANRLHLTVMLEAHDKPWAFTLGTPVALEVPNQAAAKLDAHGDVRFAQNAQDRLRYRLVSDYSNSSAPFSRSRAPALAAFEKENARAAQANPRTVALAEKLLKASPHPETDALRTLGDSRDAAIIAAERAQLALDWIKTQRFQYTLTPPLLGADSIDGFLFDTQAGFCEHFASSYVVLLRSMGVPARVVVGYQGGEKNPVDGWLTVRQANAHAWAEVWIPTQGWLRVDPTTLVAPQRIENGAQTLNRPQNALARTVTEGLIQFAPTSGLLNLGRRLQHTWRQNFDALNNAWNQWVLGYNQQRQSQLLDQLGLDGRNWQSLIVALLSGAGLFGAGIAYFYWRALAPRRNAAQRQQIRVQQAYQRFCQKLAQVSLPRLAGEGPQDYAARVLPALQPSSRNAAQEIFGQSIALLYGGSREGVTFSNTVTAAPDAQSKVNSGTLSSSLADTHTSRTFSTSSLTPTAQPTLRHTLQCIRRFRPQLVSPHSP